jgi:uncharacterized protein YpiB (UPF0302 family)
MVKSLGEKKVMVIVNLYFEREAKRKEYNAERNENPEVIAKRKTYQRERNGRIKIALAMLEEREGKK